MLEDDYAPRQALLELSPDATGRSGSLASQEAPTEASVPVLELGPEPESRRGWLSEMWRHRGVIWVLARKDFHVRFKRASLGVLWAVAVPAVQAAVLTVVFSHVVHLHSNLPYGAYVLSGVLGWSYFTGSLSAGVTSIVDASGLTDKVWFPRAILPLIPCLSGLVGLGIAVGLMLIATPILGAPVGLHLLLLIPACLLLVGITASMVLVGSALQVYFRDVRFIVSAMVTVWLYATPIMYPQRALGSIGPWLDFNPMTGVVTLFHLAVLGQTGSGGSWYRPVGISVGLTLVLFIIGVEAQRRHDRPFVDLL
jgi:lipopolysaccharide transport system permease protein